MAGRKKQVAAAPVGEKPWRERADGWTQARRQRFLEVLRMTGCVRDACRVVGKSSTSAYRVRGRIAAFREGWDEALAASVQGLEAAAYARAVEGVEVPIFSAGVEVGRRRVYSDSLMRLLLQGAAPEKYGRMGASGSGPGHLGQMLTPERLKAIEAEAVEADRVRREEEVEEVRKRLAAKFAEMNRRMKAAGDLPADAGDVAAGEDLGDGAVGGARGPTWPEFYYGIPPWDREDR